MLPMPVMTAAEVQYINPPLVRQVGMGLPRSQAVCVAPQTRLELDRQKNDGAVTDRKLEREVRDVKRGRPWGAYDRIDGHVQAS